MNLIEELSRILPQQVASDPQTLKEHSQDASLFKIKPKVVVHPKDTQDIQKVVSLVNQRPSPKPSLTIRSGGTCMSGGAINDSIILNVNTNLNQVIQVDPVAQQATTQPGAFYRDFEAATLKHGLLMPSYPASKSICTVGGMVANNAGGEKTLSYGKTKDYVKALKVILRDGQEYTLSALTPQQLTSKMQGNSLESDIYRQVFELIENNYDLIQKQRPTVSKDSTGYNLWDTWNKHTFDLTQLITGSQGTLGIISEITFRLIKPKPYTSLVAIFMRDLKTLPQIINTILRHKPESFESYDKHTLAVALKLLPQLLKSLGGKNLLSLGLDFLPEIKLVLTGGLPELVLLAEFSDNSQTEVKARAQAAQAALKNYPVKTRLARSAEEAKKYWTIRRESFNLLRHNIKDKHTAPFIDDLTVHPADLPEFLPALNAILDEYDITYTIAGHIGDANFHIIPLLDLKDPAQRQIIEELAPRVYDLVFKFKGSMSGEHNDGLIRGHFLKKMYGEEMFNIFKSIKTIFDPDNIFNPHKKTDATWAYSSKYILEE